MCLDVLRALAREPGQAHAVLAELGRETADLPGAADAVRFVSDGLSGGAAEANARAAVERLAVLAAAAALARSAPSDIAETFAEARLRAGRRGTYGTAVLPPAVAARLTERALPP